MTSHQKTKHFKRFQILRIATYNVHKCRGIDQRVRPERIAAVLEEVDADIVALQEVVGRGGQREQDQVRYVAEALGYYPAFGENRRHNGAAYGNLLLSRLPLLNFLNYDITSPGREPRGVLRADVKLASGQPLHLFNVHLGTAYLERRQQARRMVNQHILRNEELDGVRIVMGDFNEWFPGLASRLISRHFGGSDGRSGPVRPRTYPCVLPLLQLDRIYFDRELMLHRMKPHRSRKSLVASDHLPLVADFILPISAKPLKHSTRSITPAENTTAPQPYIAGEPEDDRNLHFVI